MTRNIVRALIALAFAASAVGGTLQTAPKSTPLSWQIGTYSYDGSGNIVSISGMSDTYLYDAVGRLVQASANTTGHANGQIYRYDAFGNLREVDVSITIGSFAPVYGVTVMGVEPRTNRLTNTAPCNIPGTPACVAASARGYDAAGNMRGALNGDEYDLDAMNAIVERRGVGGLRQRYLYDANGERVAVLDLPPSGSTPTSTDFTLRGASPQVLRVIRVSGTGPSATWSWREDYVYRNESLLAAAVADGTTGGKREHFHLDHLGTPRLITDDGGSTLALHTYWPFGQDAPGSETDGERMTFTGQERDSGFDSERDLDYMHARHYGPVAGRFLSVDPAIDVKKAVGDPQRWNRYAYVRNQPMTRTDPTGAVIYDQLTDNRKEVLRRQLEAKTGIGLVYRNGELQATGRIITDANGKQVGSATARADLQKALAPGATFILRQTTSPAHGMAAQAGPMTYINFNRMSQVIGGNANGGTFDFSMIVMHELLGHGVNQLQDNFSSTNRTGDTVDYENRIRRELGITNERLEYVTHRDGPRYYINFTNGRMWVPQP